jgi:hypothetical protein
VTLPVFPSLPGLTFTSVKTPTFATLDESAPNGYEVRLPQTTNPIWTWTLIYDFLHDFYWGEFDTVSELRTLMGFFNGQYGKAASFLYTDPDDNYVGPALVSASPNAPLAQLALVSDGVGNYYSPIQRTLDGVTYEDITDLNGSIAVYLDGSLASVGMSVNQYEVMGPGLAIPGYSFMGLYLKWGPGAAAWAPSHTYALNQTILDPAGHIQKCTTAGESGATEPTFNDSGGTTPDGGGSLVWTDQGYYSGPAAPVTAEFNFYFRVRFDKDNQDFEKFLAIGTTGAFVAGQGGGYWTIGGSEAQNGTGTLSLRTARPTPL